MKINTSILWGVVALLLIAGAFVGGFLLMGPQANPAPVATAPPPETHVAAASNALPQFVIQKAVYGDLPEGPSSDVTDKVAAASDGTRLSLPVSNDAFGGDPAFGIVKKVRVDYVVNGKAMTRTATEGDTLTIAPFEKPIALVIIKAVYGEWPNGPSTDVTRSVQDAFDGHTLSISATNDTFGNDPAPGIPKKLRVLYTLDGWEKYKIVEEGERITLPANPP